MKTLMNTKNWLGLLVFLSALCTVCASAEVYVYAPILDQSDFDWSSSGQVAGGNSLAQTFTPSVSGNLVQLDVFLSRNAPEANPMLISITDTLNGVPNTVLGTGEVDNVGGYWDWHSIDLSGQGIHLNANSLYAFVLSCPGTYFGISSGGSVGDSYAGGMSLVQDASGQPWQSFPRAPDLNFQTFMVTPEPSVTALMAGGLSCLLLLRSAKKKVQQITPSWSAM